jgi:hexosaminidase
MDRLRPALNMIAAQHPKLDQLSLRRAQLPQLGVLGIQSLDSIDSGTAPSAERIENHGALLKAAAHHSELTDFVILAPLQQLLDAADKQNVRSSLSRLRPPTPSLPVSEAPF